jgi:hypothetical protein
LSRFSHCLGKQEVFEENQRLMLQSYHPPALPAVGVGRPNVRMVPSPIPAPPGGVLPRSPQQEIVELPPPQHGGHCPQYEVIHPGTKFSAKSAMVFLDEYFLPYKKKAKSGGHGGKRMYCCVNADCTMLCRLAPVPNADPPLYVAEVKLGFGVHTNHTSAIESESDDLLAQQSGPPPTAQHPKKFPRLPAVVTQFIDECVKKKPKITPERIMADLVMHIPFTDLPFLTDDFHRADTQNKIKWYRQNTVRASRRGVRASGGVRATRR